MIASSVGRGGLNRRFDCLCVQLLLNSWLNGVGQNSIAVDGIVGRQTISTIGKYQTHNRLFSDCRVDPNGPTITMLLTEHGSHMFDCAIADLVALSASLSVDPSPQAASINRSVSRIKSEVNALKRLAPALPNQVVRSNSFGIGFRPPVIGAIVLAVPIAALFAALLVLIAMLIYLQNLPLIQKAQRQTIRELQEAIEGLQNKIFEEAVKLAVEMETILKMFKDAVAKCGAHPGYTPTPACLEAIRKYQFTVARILKNSAELAHWLPFLRNDPSGTARAQVGRLVRNLEKDHLEIQYDVADMMVKCACPIF
jgi:hypothetical protein